MGKENKEKLEKALLKDKNLNSCDYKYLVEKVVEIILNNGDGVTWDVENITEIDNGEYQGTLLFLIPRYIYQPSEYQYLMTYVRYGGCPLYDTLQGIQDHGKNKITKDQIKDFMSLCKDLICNMIKPYNRGWREETEFLPVEENNG